MGQEELGRELGGQCKCEDHLCCHGRLPGMNNFDAVLIQVLPKHIESIEKLSKSPDSE